MHPKIEAAWQALKDGQVGKAEHLSRSMLHQGIAESSQLPLAQALTCRAFYLARSGRQKEAVSLLQNVFNIYPDDVYAQELMIAILRETVASKTRFPSTNVASSSVQRGRLVLGLGSGRCGSTTLANLFAAQKNCYFSHEHPPLLGWNDDSSTLDFHLRRFQLLLELFQTVGDVSHWWLNYFRSIRESIPNMRAVVLRRDKEETVNSFLRIKGGGGKGSVNHWVEHDGSYWRKNWWDDCYPKYQANTLQEAIEKYWEEYYRLAEEFENEFPEQLRIFDIAILSSTAGQRKILEFCGLIDIHISEDLHANKGQAKDGAYLWPNFLEILG